MRVEKRSASDLIDILSAEYLTAIGRVASEWARFEMVIMFLVASILGKEKIAHAETIMSSVRSTRVKIEIARNMTKQFLPSGPDKVELVKALNDAEKLSRDRNKFLHSVWAASVQKEVPALLIKTLFHPTDQPRSVSIGELEDLAKKMQRVSRILSKRYHSSFTKAP